MEKAKLSEPRIKILGSLNTQGKGMNTSQVASTVNMDEELTAFYLVNLEKNGYTVGDVREERKGDKPILRRYYSIAEKGLNSLVD
jgi:predicted transcriptional regulator